MDLHLICEPVEASALWVTDIMDGIVREAMKKGLRLIASTDGTVRDDLSAADADTEHRPVLVVGYSLPWINQTLYALRETEAEPVLVSVYQQRLNDEYSFACFNTVQAMQTLVGYLAGIGCGRIALFGLHRDTAGDLSKLRGFAAGMRSHSLCFSAADIYSRGIIADCAAQLLANISQYDAVVCTNDLLAIYLTQYLHSRGIRVPEDIRITGFGNWMAAERFRPTITRMYTDLVELGAQAVRLHQSLCFNPQLRHSTAVLECTLRVGGSTAHAPSNSKAQVNAIAPLPANASPPYNSDPDIMEALRVEQLVRGTDAIDLDVLRGICAGDTYAAISEQSSVSDSTIKYRLAKMLRLLDFTDRHQLTDFVRKYHLL